MTSIVDFNKTLIKHLQTYSKVLSKDVDKAAKEIAKDASVEVKKESPSDRGKYAKSWGVVYKKGNYIVRNKEHYRLTHLLEKGHVIKNGTQRTFGDTNPQPHIKPVEEDVIKTFEKRIEELAKG